MDDDWIAILFFIWFLGSLVEPTNQPTNYPWLA
jgi:hypothetical protein